MRLNWLELIKESLAELFDREAQASALGVRFTKDDKEDEKKTC